MHRLRLRGLLDALADRLDHDTAGGDVLQALISLHEAVQLHDLRRGHGDFFAAHGDSVLFLLQSAHVRVADDLLRVVGRLGHVGDELILRSPEHLEDRLPGLAEPVEITLRREHIQPGKVLRSPGGSRKLDGRMFGAVLASDGVSRLVDSGPPCA